MVSWFKDFFTRILLSILTYFVVQAIIALVPLLVILIGIWTGFPDAWTVVTLGVGWSLTLVVVFWWTRNYRRTRAKMVREIFRTLLVSDYTLTPMITAQRRRSIARTGLLHQMITQLLHDMCGVLASRLNIRDKAASFITLVDDSPDARFALYAHVGHDDPQISVEIQKMRRDVSLAGQAIDENRCIVMKNCSKPPKGIKWSPTHNPPRYIGRASAPVQGVVQGKQVQIGAICFDTAKPWKLGKEDQALLEHFSEKIAALWGLLSVQDSNQ